ncbi:hypothetical protein TH63_06500 [Rufibacter radiotolerans]|uniref:Uncharacterized protein n=1 Tax=Rufibacter radiotolerans TaxID=1379910 RepID=A0A0H4VI18_9BACT|nr:hypothetical protein TH63_06500 [Rufibacter radiotolerans]
MLLKNQPVYLQHEHDPNSAQRLVARTSNLMGEPLAVQKCNIEQGSDSPGPLVFLRGYKFKTKEKMKSGQKNAMQCWWHQSEDS